VASADGVSTEAEQEWQPYGRAMGLFPLVFHPRPSVREQMAVFTAYIIFTPVADHAAAHAGITIRKDHDASTWGCNKSNPVNPLLESARFQPLSLYSEKLVSKFAFTNSQLVPLRRGWRFRRCSCHSCAFRCPWWGSAR
jgi:hypothetical protein